MPTRFDPAKWLKQARKQGGLLIQAAIWVIGILGGFLLPPPVGGDSGDVRVWVRLAQFVITIFVGFLVLGAYFWNQKKHTIRWAAASFVALLLATTAFFGYQFFSDAWTVRYNSQKVVIGRTFTALGEANRQKDPGITNDVLLEDVAGAVEKIWTVESIRTRRLMLAGTYLVCMPLFTIALIAVIQAISCITGKATRKPAAR